MVLIDELGDPFSFSLARLSKRFRISLVGKSQVEVMRGVLYVDRDGLVVDVLKDATRLPGVKLAVRENYV